MPTNVPATVGPYRVLGVIAEGGGSVICKAEAPQTGARVAVKILKDEGLRTMPAGSEFRQEALGLGPHPNVVPVLAHGRDNGRPYIVMEYVECTSLAERMKREPLTPAEAIAVVGEIARGLEFLHASGVVHRELTPQHILVSRDLATVRITDYAVQRWPSAAAHGSTQTASHLRADLLQYVAPEQALAPATAGPRADIYSLGVICYELLTGKLPVGRFTLPSQRNPNIPVEFDPVVLKCLAKDAGQRYESVTAFRADLAAMEERAGYDFARELRQLSRSAPVRSTVSRITALPRVVVIGATAAVAVAVLAVIAWLAWPARAPLPPASPAVTAAPVATPVRRATPQAATPANGTPRVTAPPTRGPAPAAPAPAAPAPQADAGRPAAAAPPVPVPRAAVAGATAPRPRVRGADEFEKLKAAIAGKPAPAAKADLQAFAARFADSPLAIDALFLQAGLEEGAGMAHDAISTYAVIADKHKGDPRAGDALLKQAQLMSKVNATPAEILGRLAEIARDYPASPAFVPALTMKIVMEDRMRLQEFDPVTGQKVPASLVSRRVFVAGAPTSPLAAGALWSLAERYQDIKRWDLAAQAYADLGSRFPNTAYESWFSAGELYEKRLNNPDAARAAYEKVAPGSPRYKDAQKRLQRLGR